MPTVKASTTLAAGVPVNVMANSQYRQPQFDAEVTVFAVGDPASAATIQVFSGSDLIVESAPIDEMAVTIPLSDLVTPLAKDVIQAGEQLGVIIQGAAADVVRTEVHIRPLT